MKSYKDLEVWKLSIDLVAMVYSRTQNFPANEQFGLTSQMRRAAVSIPSNTAEGQGRKSPKEFVQFLHIAKGSLAELETQEIISERLGFVTDPKELFDMIKLIRVMIVNLISAITP